VILASGIREFLRNRPFSQYLLIAFIILIAGIIIGITAIDYSNEKVAFERNSQVLQVQTEENLVEALQLTDSALKLYDNTMNRQMTDDFTIFIDEYNTSGNDPSRMDLAGLKQKFGPDMDLYIINESGVIEYSTYAPEIGLDFKTIPYFYQYLNQIRASSGFFPDRVVRETATEKLRKFAYMPTPDHRYVLELGLSGDVLTRERGSLRYEEIISNIASHNPYLKDVRIFNSKGYFIGTEQVVLPPPDIKKIIETVFQERKSIQYINQSTGITVKYLFVDLKDPDYGSDTSLIVELTYDNLLFQEALTNLLISRIIIALIAVMICFFAVFLLSSYLSKPIQDIVDDVDKIARGDLDHKIRSSGSREFDRLEQSISAMVSTLKETIRKQQLIEETLRQSEERYRAISDLITDYAFAMSMGPDKKFYIEWSTFEQVFGVPKEEILSEDTWEQFVYQADREKVTDLIRALMINERYEGEIRLIGGRGEIIWINIRTQPVWDMRMNRLVRFYAAGKDITARKQVEEQLVTLNEELEARVADRTAQLGAINKELESFSYTVSHDLRAPLRAIDGFSRILLDEYGSMLPVEGTRFLTLVRENVAQMRKLIDDLINFSHMSRKSLNLETIYPHDLVRESLEELRSEREGRNIEMVIGDLPPFRGDPAMMKLVFLNFISNALKFTRNRPDARIEIGSFQKNSKTVYFIRDNGIGFDMRYCPKLFGVFQRLHPADEFEGTGLGLAIVQRIVHRHEGAVWAEGEVGKGATFYFTIGGGFGDEGQL
jgi:PAS domain S-box-containing protein